jgi:hypothetical protein
LQRFANDSTPGGIFREKKLLAVMIEQLRQDGLRNIDCRGSHGGGVH